MVRVIVRLEDADGDRIDEILVPGGSRIAVGERLLHIEDASGQVVAAFNIDEIIGAIAE